jgi:hypothetical protein
MKKDPTVSLFETREKVEKSLREAARNPDHLINDGLKAYFKERKQKLERLRNK